MKARQILFTLLKFLNDMHFYAKNYQQEKMRDNDGRKNGWKDGG